MSALPAVAVILVTALALAGNGWERAASHRRVAARERLRERFARFVDDNRHRRVTENDVERFLIDTVETSALCTDTPLPRLRLELRDQALRLSRLTTAIEGGWGGEGLRAILEEGRAERLAWFDRVATSIDSPLEESRVEPLVRFHRVIGA